MNENRVKYVEMMAEVDNAIDWKLLVKEVLVEIYGQNLQYYCALGTARSNKPGICNRLRKGLYSKIISS